MYNFAVGPAEWGHTEWVRSSEISSHTITAQHHRGPRITRSTAAAIAFADTLILFSIADIDWWRSTMPIHDPQKLGAALQRERKRQGLPQTQLAKKVGLRQQTISAVEGGSRVVM
jgi:hypothetical protein